MKPPVYSTDKSKHYCYVLTEDFTAPLNYHWAKGRYELIFKDKLLAVIDNFKITILKGYASNGASFAPDIPAAIGDFIIHDVLYQFGRCDGCPWIRKEADCALRDLMLRHDLVEAYAYYAGAQALGWFFYKRVNDACIYKQKS